MPGARRSWQPSRPPPSHPRLLPAWTLLLPLQGCSSSPARLPRTLRGHRVAPGDSCWESGWLLGAAWPIPGKTPGIPRAELGWHRAGCEAPPGCVCAEPRGISLPEQQLCPCLPAELPNPSFFRGISDTSGQLLLPAGFWVVSIPGWPWLGPAATPESPRGWTFPAWGLCWFFQRLLASQARQGWALSSLQRTRNRFRRELRVCCCPFTPPQPGHKPLQSSPGGRRGVFGTWFWPVSPHPSWLFSLSQNPSPAVAQGGLVPAGTALGGSGLTPKQDEQKPLGFGWGSRNRSRVPAAPRSRGDPSELPIPSSCKTSLWEILGISQNSPPAPPPEGFTRQTPNPAWKLEPHNISFHCEPRC